MLHSTTALDRMAKMGSPQEVAHISMPVHRPPVEGALHVGHLQWGELADTYDRTYLPIPTKAGRQSGIYILGGHFLWVLGASLFITLGSILLGSITGPPPGSGATLAIQSVIVGLYHGIALYVAYKVAQPYNLMLHINPVVSILEFFHGTSGWLVVLVQLLAQGFGHGAAAGIAYGVLNGGNLYTSGVSAVLDTARTSIGGLVALEIIAGFFFGWVLWHNFSHRMKFLSTRQRLGIFAEGKNLPATLAATFAFTTAMVYPFGGVTMHQPLRFLQGCILSSGVGGSTCGNTGSWVYLAGGAIGLAGALLGHILTQSLDGDANKFKYTEQLAPKNQ
jgi:glycerol uptake facilitator-like aquaporin